MSNPEIKPEEQTMMVNHEMIDTIMSLMNKEKMAVLIDIFETNARQHLLLIIQDLEKDNRDNLQMHAHSLKGSAFNIGAARLGETAKDLELQIRAGASAAVLTALSQHALSELDAVHAHFLKLLDSMQ